MRIGAILLLLGSAAATAGSVEAQGALEAPLEARIWFDRGGQPILQLGDRVRLYYRVSEDAYVAVFHIDTDGHADLVFPEDPDQPHRVRGGRDYRLLVRNSAYWYVEEHPGLGYFFVVTSTEPFDFSALHFSRPDRRWDLGAVGATVHRDPFLAMDEYVERLVPDWDVVPYALDYAEYDVGDRHDYPRFLCYGCHAERPFHVWDPYYTACLNYDVYGWSDPYFYVRTRYRGSYAVLPRQRGQPRFEFKERGAFGDGRAEGPRTARPRNGSGTRTGTLQLLGTGARDRGRTSGAEGLDLGGRGRSGDRGRAVTPGRRPDPQGAVPRIIPRDRGQQPSRRSSPRAEPSPRRGTQPPQSGRPGAPPSAGRGSSEPPPAARPPVRRPGGGSEAGSRSRPAPSAKAQPTRGGSRRPGGGVD